MKRYTVKIQETVTYLVVVDAESLNEAEEKAINTLSHAANADDFLHSCDGREVVSVIIHSK